MNSFKLSIPVILCFAMFLALPGRSMASQIKDCGYGEFFDKTLEVCISCDQICYEGSWGDCKDRCKAVYLTLRNCSFDKYWDTTLETCVDCSLVCDPITKDCLARCKRFINHLTTKLTTSTTTSATSPPQSSTVLVQKNQFDTPTLTPYVSLGPILFSVMIFTGIFLLIRRYKYKNRKKTITLQNIGEKKPIQVTDTEQGGQLASNVRGHDESEPLGSDILRHLQETVV